MRRTAAFAALTAVVVGIAGGGCMIGEDIAADLETAAEFDGFPFYWLGDEFEDLEVSNVALGGPAVGLTYGTCRPTGGHGCAPPLQIQIFPLCSHLDVVAANRIWARRQIRGAPVGPSTARR